MHIEIEHKPVNDIESTSILQQTSFWAKVKQKQGFKPKAFNIKVKSDNLKIKRATDKEIDHATDDILVLVHTLNSDKQMAYVPYGPVLEPDDEIQGKYLEELSETIQEHLSRNCVLIRYDLKWESPWSDDETRYNEENNWLGPPNPEIQELRINFGTRNRKLRKSVSDNLPSNTLFLELNKEPEILMKNMKPKTRYNIRLSQRKGVVVREISDDHLDVWYDLYIQTASRNGILLHDAEYFRNVLEVKKKDLKSPADVHLLLAEYNGMPLAGLFLVISGKRATYLYGASSDKNRHLMATYALQWEAIIRAKDLGCTEYDMFGVSQTVDRAHPLYGLYRFKKGFGGKLYHRMGCWDYPLQDNDYALFRTSELNSQGYHLR